MNPLVAQLSDYEASGARIVVHDTAWAPFAGVIVTGPIPRLLPRIGRSFRIARVDRSGRLLEDEVQEDQAILLRTADGTVLIADQNQAGPINLLSFAKRITGDARIAGWVGSLSPSSASADLLRQIRTALQPLGTKPPVVLRRGHGSDYQLWLSIARESQPSIYSNPAIPGELVCVIAGAVEPPAMVDAFGVPAESLRVLRLASRRCQSKARS